MPVRAHCASKLAGRHGAPCCHGDQAEPLLLSGRHCAVGRGLHDHPTCASRQVRGARQHRRHCPPAHHWRLHGGRAQHVTCRDPRASCCATTPADSASGDLREISVPRGGVTPHEVTGTETALSKPDCVVQKLQGLENTANHSPTSSQAQDRWPPCQFVS